MNIVEEYACKREAEDVLKKQWDDVAMHLAKRIPASCRTFGETLNWIRFDDPELYRHWRLPISLEEWIVRMKTYGFGLVMKVRNGELDDTDFADGEDALKKLRSLQRAWKDHIRIRFQCDKHNGKIDVINMTLYVRGFEWNAEDYSREFQSKDAK